MAGKAALQRLLAAVEAGEIDCVVVYKVDRLSRSLLDFTSILSQFDKRNVSFVAVTQQFNTSTSLGRLTLNILLSFAQFERELIGERTRDKMSAARKKGKWVGGTLVLGYDVAPGGGRLVRIQRLVRAAPRPEPVGKAPEVHLVYFIENGHHRLLNNFVLQRQRRLKSGLPSLPTPSKNIRLWGLGETTDRPRQPPAGRPDVAPHRGRRARGALQETYAPVDAFGQERKPSLENYPAIPWESLDIGQFNRIPGAVQKVMHHFQTGWETFHIIPIESGRGCPYGCEFCTVTGFFGDSIRSRTNQSIVDEMLRLKARARGTQGKIAVFFVDDNFAINVKRTKALLRDIIAAGAQLSWVGQISANLLRDEELVDLIAEKHPMGEAPAGQQTAARLVLLN